jgi:mRNA-degrading endonuclease HigB of HigAB toxin-antitoxin module
VGHNALNDIENGDVMIHAPNMPLTRADTGARDIVSWQNYAVQWKNLGNEINGISEAMLGANPKSGTAWRQTEAMLDESYSLFELMTENKGLAQEELIRTRILPHLKKGLDTADEITDILDQYDIDRIDAMYIKKMTIKQVNKIIKDKLLNAETGEMITAEEQAFMVNQKQMTLKEMLATLGNQRFFKPSEISDKTWKEQFKNLEWDVEIDITGESVDTRVRNATKFAILQAVQSDPTMLQDPTKRKILFSVAEDGGVNLNDFVAQEKQSIEQQMTGLAAQKQGGGGVSKPEMGMGAMPGKTSTTI